MLKICRLCWGRVSCAEDMSAVLGASRLCSRRAGCVGDMSLVFGTCRLCCTPVSAVL